jgi:hypothetical protein
LLYREKRRADSVNTLTHAVYGEFKMNIRNQLMAGAAAISIMLVTQQGAWAQTATTEQEQHRHPQQNRQAGTGSRTGTGSHRAAG